MKGNNILDILIPVFNEDKTIVKTIENIFSSVKYDYKIIICYDYDEDPTLKIIRESFLDDYKIVFVKNFSRGFNNALISGFKSSEAKAVLIFMADDHINHNMINSCYEKFKGSSQKYAEKRGFKLFDNKSIHIGFKEKE